MRSRFLWTDGRNDVREVPESPATELTIMNGEGTPRTFTATGDRDPEGLPVWIEESREWVRFHGNGRRALVYQHADVYPGRFSAGAPQRGDAVGFHTGIASLDQAKRIADEASGCPQPCGCPPWSD